MHLNGQITRQAFRLTNKRHAGSAAGGGSTGKLVGPSETTQSPTGKPSSLSKRCSRMKSRANSSASPAKSMSIGHGSKVSLDSGDHVS
jgi:hypothetical protein